MWDRPAQAVTFVENHDVVRDTPIINDKLLAYAFILTHEGYPCVFWQDYFNWDLAPAGQSKRHRRACQSSRTKCGRPDASAVRG